MKLKYQILEVILFLFLLVGCGVFKNIPNAKPTPQVYETSFVEVTIAPTDTPLPTPSPTPIPEIRIIKGEKEVEKGDWNLAIDEFNNAIQNSDNQDVVFAARLGSAKVAFLSGDYSNAIIDLLQLISDFPNNNQLADAFFLLGQVYDANSNFSEAATAYARYLELHPGLIDAYVHELRGDSLFAAGDYENAIKAFSSSLASPSQLDRTFLEMKLARSFALSEEFSNALTLYDDIYTRINDPSTRALIDLRKGQILSEMEQPEQANASFLDAVNNYPSAYESYASLLTLVEAGVPVDELQRGLVDFFAGEYGVALAAFDRYLQREPADPATAHYYSGLAHRSSGHYENAIQSWDKIIDNFQDHPYWDEAWEQKGYTQWYFMDDYTTAIKTLLEFTTNNPTHIRSAEFLDDAARVAERSGELKLAADLWKRLSIEYPGDERAGNALFLSGISNYRQADYQNAQFAFEESLAISSELDERARAYLWMGKTKEKLADPEGARLAWELGANTDPTGYYSERAKDLINNASPFKPAAVLDFGFDPETERTSADAWMKSTFKLSNEINLSGLAELADEPVFIRGAELWRLGMQTEAREEFESLREAVAYDPVKSYRLVNYFKDIGLFRSATFASRNVLDLAGLSDSSSLFAPALFNRIRFGTYYSDLIMPAAKEKNLDPVLVYSVIRQESLFESFVRSSASAHGLMQIIPSTGDALAEELGWPPEYQTSDLNRPIVSVTLGTKYLADQIEYFNGDIYAALAAYNGGPGNSLQWKQLAPDDPDLFLEVIRFSETREYIRRIYEIFNIYKRLYDRSP